MIVAFDEFVDCVRFGHAIAMADGIVKKLLSPAQWPVPQHFAAFQPFCPGGQELTAVAMIGEMSMESFETLLAPNARHDNLQGSQRGCAR